MSQISERLLVQAHLDAKAPALLSDAEKADYKARIAASLKAHNAVLVAHYYTDPILQELAEETGGCVSDSLEMARFGRDHPASTLLVAGVRFMGETAKILSPEKRVLMPTLEATCSLDIGCPIDEFSAFCDQHPDRTVVVYANTSAAVKARADWVVTSSCALPIVEHLMDKGEKILWAPDQHLGNYIQRETGADMLLWEGSCIVHEEFKVKATQELPNPTFIVATDRGIFYKMQQAAPDRLLIDAPTAGNGAACRSCAHCPWMAMNTLPRVLQSLEQGTDEILVDAQLIPRAVKPLDRMLDFTRLANMAVKGNA